jgi:hypothetical protein
MAKEGRTPPVGLETIVAAAKSLGEKGPPPVHLWNPPYCGEIDMRIAADGTWFYQKTPIGRPALVKLFASVLKREAERYYLVTPVEKCGIVVDDAPFLAVELNVEPAGDADPGAHQGLGDQGLRDQGRHAQVLRFRTNVDDWVDSGPEHQLRFEPQADSGGLKPYVHVRRGLWAKVTRALYYDLVDLAEEREIGGVCMFGVSSCGEFFSMARADTLKGLV